MRESHRRDLLRMVVVLKPTLLTHIDVAWFAMCVLHSARGISSATYVPDLGRFSCVKQSATHTSLCTQDRKTFKTHLCEHTCVGPPLQGSKLSIEGMYVVAA